MSLSQLEQPVGHGRRVRGGIPQAREHRGEVESAVEAVAEVGQIARQMLGAELVGVGRVRMWRGGLRCGLSVPAPFVWRCLTSQTIAPFPHPPHRTGQADFPHPALGQDPCLRTRKVIPRLLAIAQGRVGGVSPKPRKFRHGNWIFSTIVCRQMMICPQPWKVCH
jgi:hypothetical protein